MSGEWEILRESARELRRVATTLTEPVSRVRTACRAQPMWVGPAAERFLGGIDGAHGELGQIEERLLRQAVALEHEADERERRHHHLGGHSR